MTRPRERRAEPRVGRYFECTWLSDFGPTKARVSDLSLTGCFIDSRSTPLVGQAVDEIVVWREGGEPLTLTGVVVHSTRGVGFAVRFTEMNDGLRAALGALLAQP